MFDLSLYKPSALEEWITAKYQKGGIWTAADMDIERIASLFDCEVATTNAPSHAQWDDDFCVIFLNTHLTGTKKREVFFHELCHPLAHYGNQRNMPNAFRELQEVQAHLFQLYSALPVYLLQDIDAPAEYLERIAAEDFSLPLRLVRRRLEQIERRINSTKQTYQLNLRVQMQEELKRAVGYDYVINSRSGALLVNHHRGTVGYIKY